VSPATDGQIATSGTATTPGFNVGLMCDVNENTRIGVHFRSRMNHTITGTAVITGLAGPLASFNGSIGATAGLNLPAIATVGIRQKMASDVLLFGEFEWFDWSTFNEVRIQFSDGRPDAVRPAHYRDAYAIAVGGERPFGGRWTARGGLHFDTTPTVDGFRDTTVPDAQRLWIGLVTTYRLAEKIDLELAFNQVFFRDTTLDVTRTFFDATPLATTANIKSTVSSNVNTVAFDFHFRF